MTIPYYHKLEIPNRCINFGIIENNDMSQEVLPEMLICPILGSYLTSSGFLVECPGGHKGNNFDYSIYYYGKRDLLCDNEKQDSINSYTIKSHIKRLKRLQRYLSELIKGDLSHFDSLFTDYYNWAYDFSSLNLDEIIPNLIGLIAADIEIYECFKELKTSVDDLVSITGYEDIDVFGVVIGQKPIIEVTNKYLKPTLEDKNDFLVQFVGLDKIETQLRKTITTSRLNVNEAFFNYLLMDWKVYQIPKYIINQDKRRIMQINSSDFSLVNNSGLEREMSKEIQLIKKYVPFSERPRYFI